MTLARWLCAGVVTAGMSMAAIAGAGLVAAEDGTSAGVAANSSSETSNTTGAKADSEPGDDNSTANDTANDASVDANPEDAADLDAAADEEAAEDKNATEEELSTEEQDGTESIADEGTESGSDDRATVDTETHQPAARTADTPVAKTNEPGVEPAIDEAAEEPGVEPTVESLAAESEPTPIAAAAVHDETPETFDTELTPPTARVVMSAAEVAEPVPAPTLINIIGTLFFSVFDFVVNLAEGPPVIPSGANVTVGRSTLRIDCGDGYLAEADWYFPTEGEPDKLIYFQHGAFAQAGLYNVTAAELAERNNAIVFSPSITTNFFACDGCNLSGEQMHEAVANLFRGDRAALLASAQAAGFNGTALPQRFVMAGHSGGGQTAAGAAGYYAQSAPAERLHDLAGVLLLDTSHVGGAVERGVRNIPLDIPVYHIAAAPAVLNTYGGVNEVLAQVRPGFVGVQLIGGVHADAWQSTVPLAEFFLGVGTGFSKPQNIEAVQVLAQGWITDWFNNTHTDEFYGDRSDVIPIETPAGFAQAYVIPGPAPQLTIIDFVLKALIESTVLLSPFTGNCAPDPESASTLGVEAMNGACRA